MREVSYEPDLLTRHLLGELSPTEQEDLEEAFFVNDELFIDLLDTKDQLITDYLNDRLSLTERKQFEQHFVHTSGGFEELQLADFLQGAEPSQAPLVESTNSQFADWWGRANTASRLTKLTLAATTIFAVVAILIGGWLIGQRRQENPAAQLSHPPKPVSSAESPLAIELLPGVNRGEGEIPKLVSPFNASQVELRLGLGKLVFDTYQAKLLRMDTGMAEVLTSPTLTIEHTVKAGQTLSWRIPTNVLQIADYQVTLYGVNADGSTEKSGTYSFNVRRR